MKAHTKECAAIHVLPSIPRSRRPGTVDDDDEPNIYGGSRQVIDEIDMNEDEMRVWDITRPIPRQARGGRSGIGGG